MTKEFKIRELLLIVCDCVLLLVSASRFIVRYSNDLHRVWLSPVTYTLNSALLSGLVATSCAVTFTTVEYGIAACAYMY